MKERITIDIELRDEKDQSVTELWDVIVKFLKITKRNIPIRSYSMSREIVTGKQSTFKTRGRR